MNFYIKVRHSLMEEHIYADAEQSALEIRTSFFFFFFLHGSRKL